VRTAKILITHTVLAKISRTLLNYTLGNKPVKKIAVVAGQDDLKVKVS